MQVRLFYSFFHTVCCGSIVREMYLTDHSVHNYGILSLSSLQIPKYPPEAQQFMSIYTCNLFYHLPNLTSRLIDYLLTVVDFKFLVSFVLRKS